MIKNRNGTPIQTLEDWKGIFKGAKKKHWKKGRSAYTLAEYIFDHNGLARIRSRLDEVLPGSVQFHTAIPEFEITFVKYEKGRDHNLAIWRNLHQGPSLFIGLEAKVDKLIGLENHQDYLAFTRSLTGKRHPASRPDSSVHILKIGQEELISIYEQIILKDQV